MTRKKWNIIHIPKNKEVRIVDENGSTILKNHSLSFPPDPCVPNLTEDWHLIAASPEMLEALEQANKETMLYEGHKGRYASIIAKAKGEEE